MSELIENKLKDANSIYLKRHGNNPVFWQKWCEDTFELAKKLNRPIFLSSGYASCHWCRVMEQESFSDESIADILNNNFIPIKVDKDEMPDIDKEYQFYLQSMGEAGGWPLSVFITPNKEPFFAGTYYPKTPSPDRPSFKMILENIIKIYNNNYNEIEKVINVRHEFLDSFIKVNIDENISKDEEKLYQILEFKKILDYEYGGFRQGAKFPNIPSLLYLFDLMDKDEEIYSFLVTTANKLCISAINDHIFGGFFRYTVDRKWNMPHFEKMLTDNAQIPLFLLKMYEKTENNTYLLTAKKCIDYVINNLMTEYGIVNSVDADSLNSQGQLSEGYYYKVSDRDFTLLSDGELKNFPNDATIENGVIQLKSPHYIKVAAMQPTLDKIANRVSSVKVPPVKDNKIISGINFMFASTLLYCFQVSSDEWYLNQASSLFQKIRYLSVDGFKVYRGTYLGEIFEYITLEDQVYYLEAAINFFEITKEKELMIIIQGVAKEIDNTFIKDGLPYLNTDKTIIDSFDDDKQNPLSLYYHLRTKYNHLFNKDIDSIFKDFAKDRAMRFPTGHPTILRSL